MAWFDEAIFYQIYPLGLLGAPKENDYGTVVHRLQDLRPWIEHIRDLNCTAVYLGPCFQSGSHGYDTTDYKVVDGRLGDTEDLKKFVSDCHKAGLRVVFDGVFNHTGRDFFAYQDLRKNREQSPYRDWYRDVNFQGDNSFHDGFSCFGWHGIDLLPVLNQRNPAVQDYISDVIRYWAETFDIDGIRLDAAEDMDLDFLRIIRRTADTIRPDFWLMGEVIHSEYTRFVQPDLLHAVTNYQLHKPIYSAHNSHNYFELAYNVKRIYDLAGQNPLGIRLYNFLDNHDVSRIASLLENLAHLPLVYILDYTLPGIPSIYYGSEFGIPGKKEDGDDALRPALSLADFKEQENDMLPSLIRRLGAVREQYQPLSYGSYKEELLTNRQYAFSRRTDEGNAIMTLNNDDNPAVLNVDGGGFSVYIGALSGKHLTAENGRLSVSLDGNEGEVWLPEGADVQGEPVLPRSIVRAESSDTAVEDHASEGIHDTRQRDLKAGSDSSFKEAEKPPVNKPYEEMTVEELQAGILEKMKKNGPLTEEMKRSVYENVWKDSLLNWIRSFR